MIEVDGESGCYETFPFKARYDTIGEYGGSVALILYFRALPLHVQLQMHASVRPMLIPVRHIPIPG